MGSAVVQNRSFQNVVLCIRGYRFVITVSLSAF